MSEARPAGERASTATPSWVRARAAATPGGAASDLLNTISRGMCCNSKDSRSAFGDLDLLFVARVAGVDDVQEQVGVGGLLEGGAEGRDEVLGQVADEAHGVGDDHLAVGLAVAVLGREDEAARARVEGGEELVLGEHRRRPSGC
jgi:hypothetical protein